MSNKKNENEISINELKNISAGGGRCSEPSQAHFYRGYKVRVWLDEIGECTGTIEYPVPRGHMFFYTIKFDKDVGYDQYYLFDLDGCTSPVQKVEIISYH